MVAFRNSCANGRCSHWSSCIHDSREVFVSLLCKKNLTTRKCLQFLQTAEAVDWWFGTQHHLGWFPHNKNFLFAPLSMWLLWYWHSIISKQERQYLKEVTRKASWCYFVKVKICLSKYLQAPNPTSSGLSGFFVYKCICNIFNFSL